MKFLQKRKLVLASTSKRRKKILRDHGIDFISVKSNLDEEKLIKKFKTLKKGELAGLLALSKAVSAFIDRQSNVNEPNELIVGFDTIVVCKNKIIGKPKNKKDALSKLMLLSNKTHYVYTGIGIIDSKSKVLLTDYEMTTVKMKKILKVQALSYINTKEPMDKAGAYAIQGKGKRFVKSIKGDFYNVVGLPISKFLHILRSLP